MQPNPLRRRPKELCMLQTLARFRHLSRDARLYIAMWGCLAFAYFGICAVLFTLFFFRLGYGTERIGFIASGGPIPNAIAGVPAVFLGGRFGNRNCVVAGLLLATAAT